MSPVNMSGTESKKGGSGGMIPPGTYTARIQDAFDVLANSGSEGIGVDLEIDTGEQAGSRISDTLWLTPKSMPYSKFKLEVAKAQIPTGDFEVSKKDADFVRLCGSIVGKRVVIVVGMEPDQKDPSKSWPRVKGWDEISGSSAGAPAAEAATARNDDIPF